MHTLDSRLTRLEAAANLCGPLFISWEIDAKHLAIAAYDGQKHSQEQGEGREAFFNRVTARVPARAVLWVDQQDEQL
jgi:hypothetical protein